MKGIEGGRESVVVKHRKERRSDKSLPTITVDEYCFGSEAGRGIVSKYQCDE